MEIRRLDAIWPMGHWDQVRLRSMCLPIRENTRRPQGLTLMAHPLHRYDRRRKRVEEGTSRSQVEPLTGAAAANAAAVPDGVGGGVAICWLQAIQTNATTVIHRRSRCLIARFATFSRKQKELSESIAIRNEWDRVPRPLFSARLSCSAGTR
jgi:hypothetical protein